jgi:YesN/AraC family two-component response regulator
MNLQMTKLLFVDDEPTIRLTLPRILEMHDFEVKAAANVPDALALIHSEKFDVLLSDLNIGEPSDGFTVVSAMRRTQPDAITIIITGYPAFETALEAIRGQVDDYIVKPAKTEDLIETIRYKLINRSSRHVPEPRRRVSEVLHSNVESIMDEYVATLRLRPDYPVANLTDDEIRNSMPRVLQEIVRDLRERHARTKPTITEGGKEHGRLRCEQNFQLLHLLEEIRLLRNILYSTIQENLLTVEVSMLIPDLVRISDSLDARLEETVGAYLEECNPDLLKKRSA